LRPFGKLLDGAKDGAQEAIGLGVIEHGAKIGEAFHAELVAAFIGGFEKAVGGDQDGIAGLELKSEFLVGGEIEKAGGEATFAESGASAGGKMKREGKSGIGDMNFQRRGIVDEVLAGAIARLDGAHTEAFVKLMQDSRGTLAGFFYGTQSANGKRRVNCRRKTFADHVAHVDAELSVVELEVIEKIATDFREGANEIGDFEVCAAKRFAGEQKFLEKAGFAHR